MSSKATKKSWKIGELATETGLTVRALHHYDQIGLLKPSQETEGGHRVYSTVDVEKLQKIMTLKQLGFSLDKIKEAIASPEFSLRSATTQLRMEIEKRKADLDDIESRLRDAEQFQGSGEVRADQVLQLLSRMNLFERHLTKEQQDLIRPCRETASGGFPTGPCPEAKPKDLGELGRAIVGGRVEILRFTVVRNIAAPHRLPSRSNRA